MKLLRNVSFLILVLIWAFTGGQQVRADPNEACSIRCDAQGQSCCMPNEANMKCGQEDQSGGWCMYCLGLAGELTGTSCEAEYGGQTYQGHVCQCEGPAK